MKDIKLLLLLGCSLSVVWLAYAKFLWQPNDFMLLANGDALKHYYAFSYFIQHDNSWIFSGMGYPFGEHFTFMDGHGIVAKALQNLHFHGWAVEHYAVGILHLLIFSTMLLSPVFLFLILKKLGFTSFFAFVFAFLIFILAPQWHRLAGHQSLSYQAFIPMVWWFLIKISEGKKVVGWGVGLTILTLFFGMIHPYYLPLSSIFTLAFAVVSARHWWAVKQRSSAFYQILTCVLAAFLPLVVFQFFLNQTDPFASERANTAGGLLKFAATFEGFFLPNNGVYFEFWKKLTGLKNINYEAMNYVGITGQIVLIYLIINGLYKIKNRNFNQLFHFSQQPELDRFLQAAFLVLFFSLALIFQWFPQLLDTLPTFRQFRSMGRFGWIFYFVFTVFAAFQVQKWHQNLRIKGRRNLANALFISVVVAWIFDGYQNIQYARRFIENDASPNLFHQAKFRPILEQSDLQPTDFQALIPIPAFHAGSEKLYFIRSGRSLQAAMLASHELALPISGYFASRSPVAKSLATLTWFSSDAVQKPILTKNQDNRPFLVVVSKENLQPDEENLLKKATPIATENQDFDLYLLNSADLQRAHEKHLAQQRQKQTIVTPVFFDNFEQETPKRPVPQAFSGKARYSYGNEHTLFEGTLDSLEGVEMEVAVWVFADDDLAGMPLLRYSDGQQVLETNGMMATEIQGRWVRLSLRFRPNGTPCRIWLGFFNNWTKFHLWADDFKISKY